MGKIIQFWASRLHAPLSPTGLLLGSAAFTAALTPSLIPRTGAVQGATAGLAFAVAYGLGVLLSLVWIWLGIARPPKRHLLHLSRAIQACSALTILFGLGQASAWQQTIHQALGLPAVETARPFLIAISAFGVALGLIIVGRLFRLLMDLYALPLRHVFPKRLSLLVAAVLAAWSFWAIGNGYLVSACLRALDSAYRRIDALMPSKEGMPLDPLKTGSPASLISWDSLGQEGRNRILSLPSNDDIASLGIRDWKQPLRVYVGLNSAETSEARAALALKELIRIGGFDRKLLVISTPTGTGWIDPAAMVPLEVLHKGDVTTVSVQYSYLPSWLSLLTESAYGHETARALFTTVYQHWHALPKSARPRLFLFGLSLGAMNSDLSTDMFDIVDDPYHGAFWVGPPFASRTWNTIQASKTGGTPWLPDARNRKVFRFFTNSDRTQLYKPDWGPLRVLYLQYPSDPIVFFETDVWRLPPAWLTAQHAPDISIDFHWIPGVTFLQMVVDMVLATTVPDGVGHVYSAADYTAGWLALTQPEGWDDNDLELLLRWLESKGL